MRANQGLHVVAAVLACAACTGVFERPGHDFSVRVLDESPITVVGKVYAPVRFAVDGCAAFDLAVEDHEGARRPLGFEARPDGTYLASVPVAWMRTATYGCSVLPPLGEVNAGALVATCRDAGRSASAAFTLAPQLGGGWYSLHGDIRAIFPGVVPGVPWWISASEFGGEVAYIPGGYLSFTWTPALNPAAYRNSLVRPRIARRGVRAFATLGCEAGVGCPQVPLGPGELVMGERLAELELSGDFRIRSPRAIARVSSNVVDMAFADDGALVVVSDTSVGRGPPQFDETGAWIDDDDLRWGETIVWRVTPAPEGAQGVVEDEATVIARMPRTTVLTRLSRTPGGALAFVTAGRGPDSVAVKLHVTDGSAVTTSYTADGCTVDLCFNWLAGPTFVNPGIHLSPDGSSLIMAYRPAERGTTFHFWMNTDPADRVLQVFGSTALGPGLPEVPPIYYQFLHGGAAWPTGALALWYGGDVLFPDDTRVHGLVQVFEATPPHALRYQYPVAPLPGATRAPDLVGIIAVGDHLVLTTTTGVRILDATGALVGGTDPFQCGATTTATAEQIGPTTVAVGVGDTMVTFEIGP